VAAFSLLDDRGRSHAGEGSGPLTSEIHGRERTRNARLSAGHAEDKKGGDMQVARYVEEVQPSPVRVRAASPVRTTEPIRVVIAAERPFERAGLRVLLERDAGVAVVGEAADGEDAVDVVRAVSPDVVVIDADLPGLDSVATTTQILARSRTHVIVLAEADTDSRVLAALRAGAARRLFKEGAPTQLASAVRRVRYDGDHPRVRPLRQRTFAAPTVTEILPRRNAAA
jgi:PleD family two-component response regulator